MDTSFDIAANEGCPSGLALPSSYEDPGSAVQDVRDHVLFLGEGRFCLELVVRGAKCGGCLSKIETGLRGIDGVESARMNLSTARIKTTWRGSPDIAAHITQTLSDLGYAATPFFEDGDQVERKTEQSRLLRAMAVAAFATMNVMMLSVAVWSGGEDMASSTRTMLHWISAFIALPVIAFSGQTFFRSALVALKSRAANMDVPISLALLLACGLSVHETIAGYPDTYFDAALMLTFLLLIGRYLDARLKARAGDAAHRLATLEAPSALLIEGDGQPRTLPSRDLQPGDLILIPAGQRIPADCVIEQGRTTIDAHIATGESLPIKADIGTTLYSGSLNIGHPIEARVMSAASNSFLSEVRDMVEFGLQERSHYSRLADRVARAYVPVVHTLALLTGLGWWLFSGDIRTALLNAMAVLIITCPCALGLAIPAVQIVTTGRLFAKGIIVKSGDALERLAMITHAVFDKTGTLTEGKMVLAHKKTIPADALTAAASLADASRHPIARAVATATTNRVNIIDRQEHVGEGLYGRLSDGRGLRLGSAAWVYADLSCDPKMDLSGTWVHLEGGSPYRLRFEESIRDGAAKTLADLKRLGVSSEILSGDTESKTADIGRALGASAKGGVLPRGKHAAIKEVQSETHRILMVGDGINDAPALAAADASIALASASDISRAAADMIILDDRIEAVAESVHMAQTARRRIRENLSLAILYNFCAIPLAIAGLVNPLIAAVAMSGSSLLVTANALRMARL